MFKKEIRQQFKKLRSEIPSKEKLRLDDLLLFQFQQLNCNSIQSLLTYWPMANTNEPNTHLFSSYLRHTILGLQIAYPLSNFEANEMKAVLIDEQTVYTTTAIGITEPKFGDVLQPENIEVVFVPLLTCDINGNRVGYGKGFYDKFLSKCNTNVIKIGFSYFDPIDKIDDTNSFDIPLTFCITPHRIYEF